MYLDIRIVDTIRNTLVSTTSKGMFSNNLGRSQNRIIEKMEITYINILTRCAAWKGRDKSQEGKRNEGGKSNEGAHP